VRRRGGLARLWLLIHGRLALPLWAYLFMICVTGTIAAISGKGARTFWGDYHRLAGIWSIPFVAIIGVTGTWFCLEGLLSDNGVTVSTAGIPTVLDAGVAGQRKVFRLALCQGCDDRIRAVHIRLGKPRSLPIVPRGVV